MELGFLQNLCTLYLYILIATNVEYVFSKTESYQKKVLTVIST